MEDRKIISSFTKEQLIAARRLGLVDGADRPIWMKKATFHDGDKNKPTSPYIAPADLLGHYAGNLMTGPAFQAENLIEDRDSFELAMNPSIITDKKIVEHLITDTLAVTTEGDEQVIRPNGLQFSKAANVPMGGNIEFNGGNEKHRFRSNLARKYHESVYAGKGAYTKQDLEKVEDLDKLLLSDKERRLKRAGLLASAYLTVTAEGGVGSDRKVLDRAYKVLYFATAGAQFEKHGKGAFQYQDGSSDANELEAADFIIKKGAKKEKNPLFPDYYQKGEIPAYDEIDLKTCSLLDDGNFKTPYVQVKDGSLFNREAFQKSNDSYYLDLVFPNIKKRTNDKPYYLKAILAGGGFFAKTEKGGDLRSEVVYATLTSYVHAMEKGLIPKGSVIEFPRYGNESSIPFGLMTLLKQTASAKGIHIVWTPEGDVCDFKPQTSIENLVINPADFEKEGCLAALGAADVMSWGGNEPSSASLEATFANNSNLRLVMNWWANSKVFEAIKLL